MICARCGGTATLVPEYQQLWCPQCQAYVATPPPPGQQLHPALAPAPSQPDILGILLLLTPILGIALLWFWVGESILLVAGTNLQVTVVLVVLASTLLAAIDAGLRGIKTPRAGNPAIIAAGMLLLWVIVYPLYMAQRSRKRLGARNYGIAATIAWIIFVVSLIYLAYAIEEATSSIRQRLGIATSPAPNEVIATTADEPAPQPEDPPGSFRDGTFVVGTDIAPGTYRTIGSASCYWVRLSGFGGEMGDIIANDNSAGPAIVTIDSSDKGFQSERCGLWVPGLSGITNSQTDPFGDGTYVVGTDIASGTWRADSPDDCYWARLRGFGGKMNELIANGNEKGIVKISSKDSGFKSARCGTWSRME